jgi:hypothetical protein
MLCVFVEGGDSHSVNHAVRAVKAALGLLDGCTRLDSFVKQKFGERGLPAFGLNIALHSGPVTFTKLGGMFVSSSQATPVGEAVSTALKFFQGSQPPPWSIAASVQTHLLLGHAARTGRRAMVAIPGRQGAVDAVEIVSLNA